MAGELRTPGGADDPRKSELKKGRQLPDASLRNTDEGEGAGAPRELFRKETKGKEAKQASLRAIATASAQKAHSLFETANVKGFSNSIEEQTLRDLAERDFLRGDACAGRQWADSYQGRRGETALAEIYFKAGNLGDPTAFEKVEIVLQKEQEERERMGDSYSPVLEHIVKSSAVAGKDSDPWIERFASEGKQVFSLQLAYCKQAKKDGQADTETARRYRDGLTAAYLQEGEMDNSIALENTEAILDLQADAIAKKKIFQRFKAFVPTLPSAEDMDNASLFEQAGKLALFDSFDSFAFGCHKMLETSELLTEEDVTWMRETAERYAVRKASSPNMMRLHMLLKQHERRTAGELISENDQQTFDRYLFDEAANELQLMRRDERLAELATVAAAQGSFAEAATLIAQIPNGRDREEAFVYTLDKVEASEDIANIKREEFSVLYSDMGERITLKEALIYGDTETAMAAARRLKESAEISDQDYLTDIASFTHAVQMIYPQNPEAGHELAAEMATLLVEKNAGPTDVKWFAQMMVENNDISGISLLFANAGRFPKLNEQLESYAHVSLLAEQAISNESL